MPKKAKKVVKQHVFTQEHAMRMYQQLGLILRGLNNRHIASKPLINHDTNKIEYLEDQIKEVLKL